MLKSMASMPMMLLAACTVGVSDPDSNGPLSVDEARTAVLEINDATAGDRATADVIDVSTDFTIGGRVADLLNTIVRFWDSQESCTTVSIDGNVVTLDFGSFDDGCT